MRPRIRTSASLLCYLCLPGILALWTAPDTGVSLSVGSLMQTTILVVGITSAAEIWLPRQPRLGCAVIAGFERAQSIKLAEGDAPSGCDALP